MFKPIEINGEYIEICNCSATESFNLDGYKIKYDKSSAESIISVDRNYNIAPNSFAVIFGVIINEVPGDLVINEIQYAPTDNEPEWIEIFNRSEKEINLLNYRLADKSSTRTIINESMFLSAGEYLVISKDTSITDKYQISSQLVITSFPSLNNSGDEIILFDSLGRAIDSLEYNTAWGGNNGTSLERVDPFGNSNDSWNWKSSCGGLGGTPGYINSVTQKDFDVAVIKVTTSPGYPVINDAVTLNVLTKNIGKQQDEFSLELYSVNETGDDKILLETGPTIILNPPDSINYKFNYIINNLDEDRHFFIMAKSESDQDTTNNYLFVTVVPGYPRYSILINEIMYNPSNNEPEWVEFFNNSQHQINMKNWVISDILTNPITKYISGKDILFEPKSYMLVAKDSSIYNYHREMPGEIIITNFANLNNDEDGIVLKDFRGQTIDSVKYNQTWNGIKGYSLERKEWNIASTLPANWSPSIDLEQSTPGRINSVTVKDYDLAIKSISTTPRFPVIDDDVYINLVVKNYGRQAAQDFNIKTYCTINEVELILSEYQGMLLLPGDSLVIKSGNSIILIDTIPARVEIQFSEDWDRQNNYAEIVIIPGYQTASLLINEILYNPLGGAPECFELINNSDESINLKNWSVSDVLPSPTKNVITYNDFFVEPGDLIVITFNSYNLDITGNANVFEVDFGSLGNTKDGVMLYDFRDAVIDSVMYENSWGGGKGRSLERLSLNQPTNNSSNWVTSLSELGNSIGRVNSCNHIEPADFMAVVFNEIMFDPAEDNSEYVELYNAGSEPVEIGGWTLTDESNNEFELSNQSRIFMPGDYFVLAADSSILDCYSFQNNIETVCVINRANLSLSNDGEKLYLKDLWGIIVDSVGYSCQWHNRNIITLKNKSLEKINHSLPSNDASNWSTSVGEQGGTPGSANSIFIERNNMETKLTINPNPFSPDNDGYEDFTIINYSLTQNVAQLRLKIFDSKGRLVRELMNNQPSASKGSIIFDGLDDNGRPLKMGIYIIFIEAINTSSGVVEILKDVVVVARKL